jgi:hypothetical protein
MPKKMLELSEAHLGYLTKEQKRLGFKTLNELAQTVLYLGVLSYKKIMREALIVEELQGRLHEKEEEDTVGDLL